MNQKLNEAPDTWLELVDPIPDTSTEPEGQFFRGFFFALPLSAALWGAIYSLWRAVW